MSRSILANLCVEELCVFFLSKHNFADRVIPGEKKLAASSAKLASMRSETVTSPVESCVRLTRRASGARLKFHDRHTQRSQKNRVIPMFVVASFCHMFYCFGKVARRCRTLVFTLPKQRVCRKKNAEYLMYNVATFRHVFFCLCEVARPCLSHANQVTQTVEQRSKAISVLHAAAVTAIHLGFTQKKKKTHETLR